METNQAEALLSEVCRLWAPPPDLTGSEWADGFFYLSSEYSAEPGKWQTLPFQREPINVATDQRTPRVVLKAGRQMLKSVTEQIALGYFIHQDPSPILVLLPGGDDAESFSKERIAPMIRDTPVLRGLVSEAKGHSTANTIGQKTFPGGSLSIAGAGSSRNVARRTVRVVLRDEIDKWEPLPDGDAMKLSQDCTATFRHRSKIIDACTPTRAGSNIDKAYEASDQREWFIPCPHCGAFQSLVGWWESGAFHERVRWDSTLPTRETQAHSAHIHCAECDKPWSESERLRAVDAGEWRATAPYSGIAGFCINWWYSPWKSTADVVLEFLNSKGSATDLESFVNCKLAENWVEPGEVLDFEKLQSRAEDFQLGDVPAGVVMLAAGVDVQKDWVEGYVRGFGEGKQSWVVDHIYISGRFSESTVQSQLNEALDKMYEHAGGSMLPIAMTAIDSGYYTTEVYQWARTRSASRVMVIKGTTQGDSLLNPPHAEQVGKDGKRAKRGVKVWPINVNIAKSEFYNYLKSERPKPGEPFPTGWVHFPKNMPEEFYQQLCSEQYVTHVVKGRRRSEWVKIRERNEALDAFGNYARAAAERMGMSKFTQRHWQHFAAQLGTRRVKPELAVEQIAAVPSHVVPPAPAPAHVARPYIPPVRSVRSSFL